MDKKRGGFFRGIVDNFRSSVSSGGSTHSLGTASGKGGELLEFDETLRPEHFELTEVVRYGFPFNPTALAFDPIQRLVAIGTRSGTIRILGRPGVDVHIAHVPAFAVTQLQFVVNEGQLISICSDDSVHLWNLKEKIPCIQQTLKFQRERITCIHLPIGSRWFYIGTERGNVHVANLDTFNLSGYVINWNKAIELSRKTHPGSVVHLSDCPADSNKLLIAFDSGSIILWDLKSKTADIRICSNEPIRHLSWHHEGRQFICSHPDGSISTWNVKGATKPVSIVYPHGKPTEDGKPPACQPMGKLLWKTVRNGDSFLVFQGGLPVGARDNEQCLSVIHGKTTTVLELEQPVVDFWLLCEQVHEGDFNEPYALLVLLRSELLLFDLLTAGFPLFANPHPSLLLPRRQPISCCDYLVEPPMDLMPALYSAGLRSGMTADHDRPACMGLCSDREWPVNGGEWSSATLSYAELIITGHADGSVIFWDASSANLHMVYRLKTSKLFQRVKAPTSEQQQQPQQPQQQSASDARRSQSQQSSASSSQPSSSISQQQQTPQHSAQQQQQQQAQSQSSQQTAQSINPADDEPFAVEEICFCPDSRSLCIVGSNSHLIYYKFNRNETQMEIPSISVNLNYESGEHRRADTADAEQPAQGIAGLLRQSDSIAAQSTAGSTATSTSTSTASAAQATKPNAIRRNVLPFQVRKGIQKRPAGFQAELVILTPWPDEKTPPQKITSVAIFAAVNLLAYGNENGLTIIDLVQKSVVLNVSTPELYGNIDPFQRYAKSPKKVDGNQSDPDRCKSPTSEQINGLCLSPTTGSVSTAPTSSSGNTSTPPYGQTYSASATPIHQPNQQAAAIAAAAAAASGSNMTATSGHVLTSQQSFCYSNLNRKLAGLPATRSADKLDSSFSRSRSSSICSLDNAGNESITLLTFSESFNTKSESSYGPILWVGTSFGSVIPITLTLPESNDNRELCLQSVLAVPSGNIFRLKGSMLNITLLEPENTAHPPTAGPQVNMNLRSSTGSQTCLPIRAHPPGQGSTGSGASGSSAIGSGNNSSAGGTSGNASTSYGAQASAAAATGGTGGEPAVPTAPPMLCNAQQLLVLVSDRQARVLSLPQQQMVSKSLLTQSSFAVRADVVRMKSSDSVCLFVYLATGTLQIYSLPSLRIITELDFHPMSDFRIARTISFGMNGHSLHLNSPTELIKKCLDKSLVPTLTSLLANTFKEGLETPEAPKQGLFKSLFSVGGFSLDREELFGENNSGKASKGVAKTFLRGATNLDPIRANSGTLAGELMKTRQGFQERGENLEKLEDRTEKMMNEASSYRELSTQLLNKYKDRKWYHF